MLLKIMSDLHLEFSNYKFEIESNSNDSITTLILAGDICLGVLACEWIKDLSKRFAHVIYICGNHEHYHRTLETNIDNIRDSFKGYSNIHFLEKESVVIDNVRFFGATFWTDMNNGCRDFDYFQKKSMNDFRCIRRIHKESFKPVGFTPRSAYFEFLDTIVAFRKFINIPFEGKTVIVSHHSPSSKSSLPMYIGDILNFCYYFDCDKWFGQDVDKVDLWIHGHMHNSSDYYLPNNTRVICNPYGYYKVETNPLFDPNKVVEI